MFIQVSERGEGVLTLINVVEIQTIRDYNHYCQIVFRGGGVVDVMESFRAIKVAINNLNLKGGE